ncbi:sensor histidine kinase [Caproiciproducens faecalis]|uniref:histidine kinase n=1 Tax=Caproiciproducens faecalis TaxID=2820301 RepID=A0ABS7DR10_9FIRM|nr:HAMP domain-containing sensor histidine kinase [Caproiciproducens faecalis]MBW7573531.1 HAMP domain-containing histidine kinase [Caproiciproducens faecalis]
MTISVLLIAALFYGLNVNRADYLSHEINDAFTPDYQNTSMFRQTVSNQLGEVLDALASETEDNAGVWNLLDQDSGKNILYSAGTHENPAEHSNGYPGLDLNTAPLPKGYNFKLYFDGKKVTVTKDGKTVDIYGDGVYRPEKSMWYVPGYTSNTSFSYDNMEEMQVTLLARSEPVTPVSGYTSLTYIPQAQHNLKITLYAGGVFLLLGAIAFMLYLLLRKDKKAADLALARFTGWFWWEFKAICTVVLVCLDFAVMIHAWRNDWFLWGICTVISFFCYYLVVNDMRCNHHFYKHNIFNTVLKNYRKFERSKPFQQQMVQRFWALLASEILLLLFGFTVTSMIHPSAFFVMVFLLLVLAAMVYVIYRYVRRFQNTVYDMGLLMNQISLVKSGDLITPLELPADADLNTASVDLNEIQLGIDYAVEERLKSERMKIELITNVSHDLKTPLTAIISYIDLLKQEENLPDHIKDYIEILAQKSDRLKNMVQDIFQVSKATSGNIELNMEVLDYGKLILQTMADMNEQVEASGLIFKVNIPDSPVMIRADGKLLYRVFQNLIGNALQYSLEGSRVFVTLEHDGKNAYAAVKNTSRYELDCKTDMTERFVRGDSSRTTTGSGLGLSIAKSFTEATGGRLQINVDADLFSVRVDFPLTQQ